MNVVYVKNFENGKKYVGISSNFNSRMRRHNYEMRKGNSLPLYNAMRKYSHYTDVVFESDIYEDVLEMEKLIIQNFKDLGVELYNITDGGQGMLGLSPSKETREKISKTMTGRTLSDEHRRNLKGNTNKMSEETKRKLSEAMRGKYLGANGTRAKTMEYYSQNSVVRSNFKTTCRRMGWDFNDFDEVFDEWYVRPNGKRDKKYFYIYKGDDK